MRPGYYWHLLNGNVISGMGADWVVTLPSMAMFLFAGAKERTERDWHRLVDGKAGIKFRNIWSVANGQESFIECKLLA
ncbi:hypothetical protein MMYC01_207774 [Madurella mycetomatis]|uniref:Uncharacterized protein n=1 Tax=Madurella mycetomatis TaxID=100816 RepID=A0A175VV68_9PEZI|nr:hypothetical protein MMYC01_207774 [Madurella mycetomatis]